MMLGNSLMYFKYALLFELAINYFLVGVSGDTNTCNLCLANELPFEEWSYEGATNGPDNWPILYDTCGGQMQSPINIDTKNAKKNTKKMTLNMKNYRIPIRKGLITNNGHTVVVTPQDNVKRTITINGMTYTLRQFHFHWNRNISDGSEHAIDGSKYAFETHFVHMNKQNEIAVVGVLYTTKEGKPNYGFKPVVTNLKKIAYKGQETQLNQKLKPMDLLPTNAGVFYRYQGSLTTPPCTEGVVWSVLAEPSHIGLNQLKSFFNLYAVEKSEPKNGNCKINENVRPLQPLNGRKVIYATPPS